jgi:type II secretory pathway component PulK
MRSQLWNRRRDERGVAMFVVMMLVVMVSAAGVFVARSSALEIRSSGFVRMAGQTHYVTESGAVAVVVDLPNDLKENGFSSSTAAAAAAAAAAGAAPGMGTLAKMSSSLSI